MVKLVTLLVVLLFAVSIAWAADKEVQGKVKGWDAAAGMVTLEDGTVLSVPASVAQRGDIKEGATVKVSYEEKDGKKVVSKIEVAKP
jgi:Cu/Ag efflux protein CusF